MLRWLELRWQEREGRGCGIQVPAPKQSREQGVLCLWAVSHLCFCLPGCGPGAFQTNVTEKETWTGESPQPRGCKRGVQEVSSGRKRSSKGGNTS